MLNCFFLLTGKKQLLFKKLKQQLGKPSVMPITSKFSCHNFNNREAFLNVMFFLHTLQLLLGSKVQYHPFLRLLLKKPRHIPALQNSV